MTWIGAISRGHNAGVCLMKDGEIVFSLEEERLTRIKYDGAPLAAILKMKEYEFRLVSENEHVARLRKSNRLPNL